jgi:hypothetical protein
MGGAASAVTTIGPSLPVFPDEQTLLVSVGKSQTCEQGRLLLGLVIIAIAGELGIMHPAIPLRATETQGQWRRN